MPSKWPFGPKGNTAPTRKNFRTNTLNNARRSFRSSFQTNSDPVDDRQQEHISPLLLHFLSEESFRRNQTLRPSVREIRLLFVLDLFLLSVEERRSDDRGWWRNVASASAELHRRKGKRKIRFSSDCSSRKKRRDQWTNVRWFSMPVERIVYPRIYPRRKLCYRWEIGRWSATLSTGHRRPVGNVGCSAGVLLENPHGVRLSPQSSLPICSGRSPCHRWSMHFASVMRRWWCFSFPARRAKRRAINRDRKSQTSKLPPSALSARSAIDSVFRTRVLHRRSVARSAHLDAHLYLLKKLALDVTIRSAFLSFRKEFLPTMIRQVATGQSIDALLPSSLSLSPPSSKFFSFVFSDGLRRPIESDGNLSEWQWSAAARMLLHQRRRTILPRQTCHRLSPSESTSQTTRPIHWPSFLFQAATWICSYANEDITFRDRLEETQVRRIFAVAISSGRLLVADQWGLSRGRRSRDWKENDEQTNDQRKELPHRREVSDCLLCSARQCRRQGRVTDPHAPPSLETPLARWSVFFSASERQCQIRSSLLDRPSEPNVKFSIRSSVRTNKSKETVRSPSLLSFLSFEAFFSREKLSSETLSPR